LSSRRAEHGFIVDAAPPNSVDSSASHCFGAAGGLAFAGAAAMLFLRFTLIGLAIRAVGENPEAAQANGISVPRIHLITFARGSALAGAAGALITPVTYAFPAMGFNYTLYAFITIIIGGLGSVWGAVLLTLSRSASARR
jgi:branched-chain amino acid transport system permease protein